MAIFTLHHRLIFFSPLNYGLNYRALVKGENGLSQ